MEFTLLYRDALVLIIDKPAGINVHKGPSGGESLEDYFEQLRFGLPRPPALAHRLDRDTSGCLVLGRHPKALRKLGRIFSEGLAEKTYWALVHGAPNAPEGYIDAALLKISSRQKGWRMVVDEKGQPSQTAWRLMGSARGMSWLELKPKTGRTHQIRAHCQHLGHPIVGDPIYGPQPATDMMMLHARAISLPLYEKKLPVNAIAEPPSHMKDGLTACGYIASHASDCHG
jgi:tRNA pseudouridine32 synthase/23S rRNA pseudouridine746 synthase/23S rRNA pseudouridine1911/1915/1917 synthase